MALLSLHLRHARRESPDTLRPVLERTAAAVGQVVLTEDDLQRRRDLEDQLQVFTTALQGAQTATDVAALTPTGFALCEQTLLAVQAQRDAEARRLVVLIRETLSAFTGEGQTFRKDVQHATGRLGAILQQSDLAQLRRQLTEEIGHLQQLTIQQQERWQRTVERFDARVTSLEAQLEEVRRDASLDALTGIANRRHFERRVTQMLAVCIPQVVVAMFDLDSFKAINDEGGHAAGDRVLRSVAEVLEASVRRDDVAARFGGDEFTVALLGPTAREAEPRLRAILSAVNELPTGLSAVPIVSASCGVSECAAGDTLESLLSRADQALYEAKRQGKRRLVVHKTPLIRDLREGAR